MARKREDRLLEDRILVDQYRFKLTRKIAEGGMGAVYEAVQFGDEGFEKQVAIKCIQESLSKDKEFVEMFIGEAKLVANLVHQNIVQIYHLGKAGDMLYIAMEFLEGVNLQEFMNRHYELGVKVPVDIAAFIISRVCRALEYAHRKTDALGNSLNVVHRDVSPKNMMISTEGVVKLTDFGIAKARDIMRDQEGDVLMGKAQYMSPEQAQYLPTDNRSDIFSLGVVGFELLTGQNLFGSDKTSVILDNVITREIPRPSTINSEIPKDLEALMMKAVERQVSKRFQDAGRMGYELEYYMYHDRFGPTNVTLEKYMAKMFPELFRHHRPREEKPGTGLDTEGTTSVKDR